MVKISKEAALEYHYNERPGKIEVKPTKPYRTQTDLSLAYSPGVAYPCLEIQQDGDRPQRSPGRCPRVRIRQVRLWVRLRLWIWLRLIRIRQ